MTEFGSKELDTRYEAARSAVEQLPMQVADVFNETGPHPAPGSPIESEKARNPEISEWITNAYSRTSIHVMVSANHVSSFAQMMMEPISPFTTYLAARSVLELCAQGLWLSDPNIAASERVRRNLCFRLLDVRDQATFIRTSPKEALTAVPGHESVLSALSDRIKDCERQAECLGIELIKDRRGRTLSVGPQIPSATDLAEQMLDASSWYRLYSAVSHGRVWAALTLGLEVDRNTMLVTERVTLDSALSLLLNVFGWYATWSRRYATINGWDLDQLTALFDSCARALMASSNPNR